MWIEISWPRNKAPDDIEFDVERKRFLIKRVDVDELSNYDTSDAHVWICGIENYNEEEATMICGYYGEPLVPMRFSHGRPIFIANKIIEIFIKKDTPELYTIDIYKHYRRGREIITKKINHVQITDDLTALSSVGLHKFSTVVETGLQQMKGETDVRYYISRESSDLGKGK